MSSCHEPPDTRFFDVLLDGRIQVLAPSSSGDATLGAEVRDSATTTTNSPGQTGRHPSATAHAHRQRWKLSGCTISGMRGHMGTAWPPDKRSVRPLGVRRPPLPRYGVHRRLAARRDGPGRYRPGMHRGHPLIGSNQNASQFPATTVITAHLMLIDRWYEWMHVSTPRHRPVRHEID